MMIEIFVGALGNNAVDNYEYQSVYNKDNYILGNAVMQGLAQTQLANAMVSWETSMLLISGFDFNLFGSKLDGTIDVFNKDTRDILRPSGRYTCRECVHSYTKCCESETKVSR